MAKAKKFGAISGVFTPSILTILGVIMYLRLPWIVGQAGLWATIGIILVAHIISLATGLSVASIATDKKVETGGSYYIISRSLGLPIGGTLGIALFIGLSFSISLYLIGFSEVLLSYFGFEVTINNIRITGALALLALTIVTFISTSLAIKAQYIILTALVLSLLSVFLGNQPIPEAPLIQSMTGSLPWIALFAIFFPAVTGFEAGVSMSGDLKDPRKNIPVGTIAAVLTGLVVYIGLAFFFSHRVGRDLLVNDPNILFNISWIPQLVLAGILGATLSSALGSILGAPRILQATAIDRITPGFLGKGVGASNEPRNALLFTFFIALSGILIGELNVIARIVTIFFIITYGFLNITYAVESWAGTDFRPSFRINPIISVIGAVTSIIIMIQLDVVAMIGASIILFGLFLFLKKRELTLHSGDTWNSVWASMVKTGLGKLISGNRQSRNWRPNIILFSGGIKNRPHLVEISKALAGKLGIFTNFELIENREEKTLFSKSQQVVEEEGPRKGIFTRRHVCRNIYEGMESIAKIYGFSGFEPNTILMGWPRNSKDPDAFARLYRKFKKLDLNQIFLSIDKTFYFGKRKHIDIWWSGKGRNISLAITLLKFIHSSHEWRTATVRILVINNLSAHTEKYYELLDQILENLRMNAEIKVINNSVESLPVTQIMRSESINTDLAILDIEDNGDDFFTTVNQLTESLPSSLVISASSDFEEHSVVSRLEKEPKTLPEKAELPSFRIAEKLKLAEREIIANEVFNLAQNLEPFTSDYFQRTFLSQLNKTNQYFDELLGVMEKTSDQLYKACNPEDIKNTQAEFLRIINDFSYRAQSNLKNLKKEVIAWQKQDLESGTEKYLDLLQKTISGLPPHIRVKYNRKEYARLKSDSFATSANKIWKLFAASVTGKKVTYKIKVTRPARYLIYHKRLLLIQKIFHEFAMHNFRNIILIRKVLEGVYSMAEKGKISSDNMDKIKNIILMEKDRFSASISLQKDTNKNFYHQLGSTFEDELLGDLQNLNNILARPGANFMSKPFLKPCRKDKEILENIESFPETWLINTNLFINKIYLDFLLQSLKNRIESKIKKYNFDYNTAINATLISPLHNLQQQLDSYLTTQTLDKKPDKSHFKLPSPEEHYNKLFNEIMALFADLPLVISITADDFSEKFDEKKFAEMHEVLISVRKTVEFSISSELIDYMKKQVMESSVSLGKITAKIKDNIRLINFNLFDETETEIQEQQEKHTITQDFIKTLLIQEKAIENALVLLENEFSKGLKNTFAPLSSAVIAKSSGKIQKKFAEKRNQKLFEKISNWQSDALQRIQKSVVGLIYSKSEGILWMGRMERPTWHAEISKEDMFVWLDKFTPKKEVKEQLPFYYSKLFSGQSGIGDDFWIGMEAEAREAEKAVARFKDYRTGCVIISGHRNSGKTSLSKYVAKKNFPSEDVHSIRAPRECTADIALFENTLLNSLHTHHTKLESCLLDLQNPIVFIINDLELWWERTEDGTRVVERLIELIRKFTGKVLFIVNVNLHALQLINRITSLQSWSLGMVTCTGFDARELRDLIMVRHQAGGMSFYLDKKHESQLSEWDMASLFNRIFDITKGNPGFAINIWLSSIQKVSNKVVYVKKPDNDSPEFLDKLTNEQIYILLQFVYHMRLSIKSLSYMLHYEESTMENLILNLWQPGILQEKFPGIYTINPALNHALVAKVIEKNLI